MPSGCGALKVVWSMPPNKPASKIFAARALSYDGAPGKNYSQAIAVETPVNIIYGSIPFAVMMTSPVDLEDFAYGFSFTEGIIDHGDDIRSVHLEDVAGGLKLSVMLRADTMQRHLGRARNLTGRTGCGVCGIADLSQMPERHSRLAAAQDFDPKSVAVALKKSQALQQLNAGTRAVHSAAFCNWQGQVVTLREDVGRHNALDKLIGALLRNDVRSADGFILISSRASYEMIEKTVRFGAPVLVAMSAPTSLAIERAQGYGLTLIAIAREDGAILFSGSGGK